MSTPLGRSFAAAVLATALAGGLAACASSGGESPKTAAAANTVAASGSGSSGSVTVTIGAQAGSVAQQTDISVTPQPAIEAEVPAAIKADGALSIGEGALPAGFPPLAFVGDDDKTLTGSEPDLGRLIAAVLGLQPKINNDTWDNLFVGIDSGRNEVGISNITDTEERKEKYDFASYREDNLGFAVKAGSSFTFDKTDPNAYEKLAGLKVAVDAGTNQEKILLAWQNKLKAEGKKLDVKYFGDETATWKAVQSGQIDAYFSPNPGIAYEVSQTKGTPGAIADAGTYSGAGATLQGLIAATTKKGSDLAKPLAEAINYLIQNGQYKKWLDVYGLGNEAVDTSQVNPPGLPKSNG